MPEAFRVSTYSIACGAGSVIALMTWLGVIGYRPIAWCWRRFFVPSGLTSLVSTLLMRSRVMSPAEELVLRPEN